MGRSQSDGRIGAQFGAIATGLGSSIGSGRGEFAQIERGGVMGGAHAGAQRTRCIVEQQFVKAVAVVFAGLDARERSITR
ncbi:hypothetical protein D3C84_1196560 [compost metagenome]